MPFENLSERFQAAFKKLRGKGKLTEEDVNEALKEMRRALLEADVNFAVTKDFIKRVREKAVGEEVFSTKSYHYFIKTAYRCYVGRFARGR